MTTTVSNEKTRYLRDPKNPNRVMTLVTRVEKAGKLKFAIAMNTPKETRSGGIPYREGDRFTRKQGVAIARARLDSRNSSEVRYDAKLQHPVVVALSFLATHKYEGKTTSIARIARAEIMRLSTLPHGARGPTKVVQSAAGTRTKLSPGAREVLKKLTAQKPVVKKKPVSKKATKGGGLAARNMGKPITKSSVKEAPFYYQDHVVRVEDELKAEKRAAKAAARTR